MWRELDAHLFEDSALDELRQGLRELACDQHRA